MIGSRGADIVGFIGAFVMLGGFAYQTLRKAEPDLLSNALNLVGAALLALSLFVNYNLPALSLEIAWAAIALTGLVRTLVTRR